MGIAGGALATSIACFLMMVPCIYFVFKLTKTKAPTKAILKIITASAIMGIIALMIPKNSLFLFPAIIICVIVYFFSLIFVKFFKKEDIENLRNLSSRFGPLSKVVERLEFR